MLKRYLPFLLILLVVLPVSAAKRRKPRKPAPKRSVITQPKTVAAAPAPTLPGRSASWKVAPDLDRRIAQFKPVQMPFQQQGLSPREVQLVDKLVEACGYLEAIYWRQSDPEALSQYQQLEGSTNPQDQTLRRLLFIHGSRYDLLDDNKPFVGTETVYAGRGFYPQGLSAAEFERYTKAHPEKRNELLSQFTVVRRRGDELEGLPFHVAYRSFLEPAAAALREAAILSDDAAFAEFLRKRADALLTDDYYPSDLLWVDLKNPKFDIIFAPYETYLDELMGLKGSYGAAVLIRNEAESRKLAVYQRYVADIQDALPIDAADKPSKRGQVAPMEVMDSPYRGGDLLHGYQAVADNLPNDPRIHQSKGTKKIFFKNFMDARMKYVVLPVAQRLMRPDQAAKATADAYLATVLLHEISHGIGPAYARTANGKQDIREALGPIFSPLEEAKADATGMFGLKWLADKGAISQQKLEECYAAYIAGILRSVRFGVAEAHGRAEMMEFNYLLENGAIRADRGEKPAPGAKDRAGVSRYIVDYAKMPAAVAGLTRELLTIEATGDRQRAERWFARYDKMPAELRTALERAKDVPVDFYPVFSFPEVVQ